MEEFIVNLLAVMVLLNFILNLTSVYLGRYKKQLLDEKLDHILDHLCPAYQLDDEDRRVLYNAGTKADEAQASELSKKLSKDRANFEEWDNLEEVFR
jgi:hypothetical protein